MMWKRFSLVILILSVPVLSKFSPSNVISTVIGRLGGNLDYISQHYDKINVDCLFGVVMAGAILDDTITQTGPYQQSVQALKVKTQEIFTKMLPIMEKHSYWIYFAKYIVIPELWEKQFKYKTAEFKMAYAMKSRVEALFSNKTYEKYSEGFSDTCIGLVINSTLSLKPQSLCHLSHRCEDYIANLEEGSGYVLTHKLLLLQIARARKCKMHPKTLATVIKKACTTIYTELISTEYFVGLDEIFDLFLEQILLCGYEGFADFLKMKWLEKILKIQHDSGCFPATKKNKRKREIHVWKDGCTDHTTGLGAAVLSLYLNYVLKNADTVVLTSEWF